MGYPFGYFLEKNNLVNLHGILKILPLHGILKVPKKMKKVFALLTIVSVMSFVACKNNTKTEGSEDTAAQTEQQADDQAEAEAAETEATPADTTHSDTAAHAEKAM